MDESDSLERAYALLKRGQYADAEAACRAALESSAGNAAAIHLLGLIRKDTGDPVDGERLLRESIATEPGRADFRANLAHLLAKLGRLREAAQGYRESLGLDPTFRPARLGLTRTLQQLGEHAAAESEARVLIAGSPQDARGWAMLATALAGQLRFREAELAWRSALEAQPRHLPAAQGLGVMLAQTDRAEEAIELLDRAQSLGGRSFDLVWNRGRALTALYRLEEAESAFAEAVSLYPLHAEAQLDLARVRFMRGDAAFTRELGAAAAAHPDDVSIRVLSARLLLRAGDAAGAEAHLRGGIERIGAVPALRAALAELLHESGRLKEAEHEALEASAAAPHDASVIETLVAILIARGKPGDAEGFIAAQRTRHPFDQTWIAWEATAARLLGTPRYAELYDYQRLVRSYVLEPPAGFGSLAALNDALAHTLDSRHSMVRDSLDANLRNGSLTVRNLATDPDSAIRAALEAFAGPLESYREAIGTDPAHPLTARNRGRAGLAAAWSVQLRRSGVLLNHVRPGGWISGIYYVAAPPEVADVSFMPGWLRFGEPRMPAPEALPECFIKPQPGVLVLFPACMWHGTTPLRGPGPLTTIAFDALPMAR